MKQTQRTIARASLAVFLFYATGCGEHESIKSSPAVTTTTTQTAPFANATASSAQPAANTVSSAQSAAETVSSIKPAVDNKIAKIKNSDAKVVSAEPPAKPTPVHVKPTIAKAEAQTLDSGMAGSWKGNLDDGEAATILFNPDGTEIGEYRSPGNDLIVHTTYTTQGGILKEVLVSATDSGENTTLRNTSRTFSYRITGKKLDLHQLSVPTGVNPLHIVLQRQ